jgi:hypothetical protein
LIFWLLPTSSAASKKEAQLEVGLVIRRSEPAQGGEAGGAKRPLENVSELSNAEQVTSITFRAEYNKNPGN